MTLPHFLLELSLAAVAISALATATRGAEPPADNDARARRFIAAHEAAVRPLEIEVARAWWEANVTGKDEAYRHKEEAETPWRSTWRSRDRSPS